MQYEFVVNQSTNLIYYIFVLSFRYTH